MPSLWKYNIYSQKNDQLLSTNTIPYFDTPLLRIAYTLNIFTCLLMQFHLAYIMLPIDAVYTQKTLVPHCVTLWYSVHRLFFYLAINSYHKYIKELNHFFADSSTKVYLHVNMYDIVHLKTIESELTWFQHSVGLCGCWVVYWHVGKKSCCWVWSSCCSSSCRMRTSVRDEISSVTWRKG